MTAAALSATGPRRPFASVREFAGAVVTITVKELRSRMRGRRAFVVLTLYLAVLAAIAYGAYLVTAPNARAGAQFGGFDPFGPNALDASASVGRAIFALLSLFQLLLVCFIAPAFTAGTISLEREKQTLDLLVSTPLRPGGIVLGKLVAALAYVFLMIIAGLPLSALVLMYGGVAVEDLLRQQVVLFVSALGFGSIGLFFSALVKRTQPATVLTYSTMLALTIGTVLVYSFWSQMQIRNDPFGQVERPDELLWLNPGIAMAEVIASTESPNSRRDFGTFLSQLWAYDPNIVCEGGQCFFPTDPVQRDQPVPMPRGDVDGSRPLVAANAAEVGCPPGARCAPDDAAAVAPFQSSAYFSYFWPRFALTFPVMSVILAGVSMWLVVPAGMRFAFRRRKRRFATIDATMPGAPAIEPLDEAAER
jgi:ABC-type transport system involved in multi-copper enzyme maturation permease subunit